MSPQVPTPSRRRWLESVGLLALGSGISAKFIQSQGFPSLRTSQPPLATQPPAPPSPSPVEQLVLDHPAEEEAPPSDYAQFLARFSFRYIQPHEVIQPHYRSRNGVENALPPSHLWPHIPASLFVADEIRHRLGKPLNFITSAYRTPEYNRQCGGASRSWHTQNYALDLVFEGGPKAAHAIALQLRDEGFFQGGVGLYKSFIHIDTRGQNATWGG